MPVVSPRPYAECRRLFHEECVRLAELAFHRYCRNSYQTLLLCGTKRAGLNPRVGIWERLSVATAEEIEARPELEIVRQDKVPCHLTLGHLTDVIRDWLGKEPLAIFAD